MWCTPAPSLPAVLGTGTCPPEYRVPPQGAMGRQRGGIRGERKRRVNVVLRLEVGPEGPHRHLRPTLLASYLPPTSILSVEVLIRGP